MEHDYLKRAQALLARKSTRVVLQIIPMALVAVSAAHATPTFNAPNNTNISVTGCSGGTTGGSLTGAPTNTGVSLSGNATVTNNTGTCTLLMVWQGTGSGAFTSASYSSSFVITIPNNNQSITVTSYSLAILINGVAQPPVTCSAQVQQTAFKPKSRVKPHGTVPEGCAGTITVPITNIPGSGTLNTYEADLSVTGQWAFNSQNTLTVSVPSGATIDITASAASVPALSPEALAGTALLLALSAFCMASWKPSRRGTPGPPA